MGSEARESWEILAAYGAPAILIDRAGVILGKNGPAARIISEHPVFGSTCDQVRLRRNDEALRFDAALQLASHSRRKPSYVTLASRSGRPILVMRLAAVGDDPNGPVLCEIEDLVAHTDDAVALAQAMGITVAQARVAALLARGMNVPEIARELGLKEATLRTHIRHALGRLGLDGQQALAVCAAQMARFMGIVHPG